MNQNTSISCREAEPKGGPKPNQTHLSKLTSVTKWPLKNVEKTLCFIEQKSSIWHPDAIPCGMYRGQKATPKGSSRMKEV